jgi:hypothetical protein
MRIFPMALGGLLVAAACSSPKPVGGSFTVDFPSTAAAVATDNVQVFAFPFTTPDTCQTLFEERRSKQPPATGPIAESAVLSPCDLLAGKGTVALGFGNYAFLGVGQRGGSDFLIGCAAQAISDSNSNVVIPLTLASNQVSVPTTMCTALSQHCAGGCM